MTKRATITGQQKPGPHEKAFEAFQALVDATRALFHRLRAAAEELHGWGELSAAQRGVLESLQRLGPQTVPQMARARPVSRQHIQKIVNLLLEDGLVELLDNPAHKRSHQVRITSKGSDLLHEMYERERRLWSGLDFGLATEDLGAAAEVLKSVKTVLESKQWKHLLKQQKPAPGPARRGSTDRRR